MSIDPGQRPTHLGLHHVALSVGDLAAARHFWVDLLGFRIEWEPDGDNLYLTSGSDNLALHRSTAGEPAPAPAPAQRLDHLGVICRDPAEVDAWHRWLVAHAVRILAPPRRHRDGAYSFYCQDQEGIRVQVIHHPPISRPLRLAQGGAP